MTTGSKLTNAGGPVVVIGASTAGLFSAYLLAKGGMAVRVYDQAEELGPPARTLILTSCINQVLGYVPSSAVANRTHTVQLFSPRRSTSIHLNEADLIVERQELVRLLAERAAAAGARIHLGHRFVGLEPGQDGLVVVLENSRGGQVTPVRTRTLIGADGVHSQVAEAVGRNRRPTISLLQARVAMPSWAKVDTTQVWFDPEGTPYFYWLVPGSPSRAVVGLIADDGRKAGDSLRGFLSAQGLEPLGYQAAQVPFRLQGSPLWRGSAGSQVLLVGDAAGQVKVTTVGGVVTGLGGAQAAARAVLRGTDYRLELAGLRTELGLHLLVRRVMNRFRGPDYDELLDLVNRRTRGVLAAFSRDEIVRVLFPSLLAQPRLLWLAARAMQSRTPLPERGDSEASHRAHGQVGLR